MRTNKLTPEQAANVLKVSLQYLNNLLDSGELKSLSESDVVNYREAAKERSLVALKELAKVEEEQGLFDAFDENIECRKKAIREKLLIEGEADSFDDVTK